MTRLHGAFQDSHQVWLVMELGEGGDLLEKLLAEGHAMTEAHVCKKIAVPLLTTLKALHELHIIHRWSHIQTYASYSMQTPCSLPASPV